MDRAVATQGAVASSEPGARITHASARGGGYVDGIEVDQSAAARDAMRVVAGGAGGFVFQNVFGMSLETLVREDAFAVMAFIAESVTGGAFG